MSSQPRTAGHAANATPDCCDPVNGHHVFQSYVRQAHEALARTWTCPRRILRPGSRQTDLLDTRDTASLTPYLPPLLADTALDTPEDLLLVVPGQVETAHCGVSHRLALVRLSAFTLGAPALARLVPALLGDLLPGRRYRLMPQRQPLLRESMALEILGNGNWHAIGHCGRIAPEVLDTTGLASGTHDAVVIELGLEQIHDLRGPVTVR